MKNNNEKNNNVSYTRAYLNLTKMEKDKYINTIFKDIAKNPDSKNFFNSYRKSEWKTIFHHATVNLGPIKDKYKLGENLNLIVDSVGIINNDEGKAIALRVTNMKDYSDNKQPHITLMVRKDGGMPVDSNKITDWIKLETKIIFPTTVEEFEYGSDKPRKREPKVISSLEKHYEEHIRGIDSAEMSFS